MRGPFKSPRTTASFMSKKSQKIITQGISHGWTPLSSLIIQYCCCNNDGAVSSLGSRRCLACDVDGSLSSCSCSAHRSYLSSLSNITRSSRSSLSLSLSHHRNNNTIIQTIRILPPILLGINCTHTLLRRYRL